MSQRGGLHPFSLAFVDEDLEARFQSEQGETGLGGYRIITAATVVLWLLAVVLFPLGTKMPASLSTKVGLVMASLAVIAYLLNRWAVTMDRQHGLAVILTSANGVGVLYLTSAGDVVERFAAAALILILVFGFVSRTRFVYALMRTFVFLAGFGVVVLTNDGPNLLIDVSILTAAAAGSLLGLRRLERDRRVLWHRERVIADQAVAIDLERAESERLLLNVLPASVSRRLRRGESPIADSYESVSVLFADIVGFTRRAAGMSAAEVVGLVDRLFSAFDDLVVSHGVEKIKTIGDAYMVAAGIPEPLEDHAPRLVGLGLEMIEHTEQLRMTPELAIRVGIHSGPVTGGVVGTQKFAFDVWGNTVNVAARIEKAGEPGRVHVSEATMRLCGDSYRFEPTATTELKGLGPLVTYYVATRSGPE